jgi:hypothetical protein
MDSCSAYLTSLAARTPVYDEDFLYDWKPLGSPVMGRHNTKVWTLGTGATHIHDEITIGQPNLSNSWQTINAADCANPCAPPRVNVAMGSVRTSHGMQQFELQSQLWCLTQLRYSTEPAEQLGRYMEALKKMPEMYNTDFIRVHAFDMAPTVYICGKGTSSGLTTFTPTTSNVSGQLTTVDLGSAANLPTSQLNFNFLRYISTILSLEGYDEAGSGLAMGMYNLITDKDAWFNLTNGNPSMKEMMALQDPKEASPLYKIGEGIQTPFGNFAPTIDTQPIRFQLLAGGSGGVLERVYPYINVLGTTGLQRLVNPAYVNARYQLSFIWHPKAITIYTPDFKKVSDKVPTVNSAMFGSWVYKNGDVMIYTQPDGTVCTINNDNNDSFYWLSRLEMGFEYQYPKLMAPILHLVDESGLSSIVNVPVCGTAPQYVAQNYSDDPLSCQA